MKTTLKVAISLVALGCVYVGSYFGLMRHGFAVDFTTHQIVAPTYSIFSSHRQDPVATAKQYVAEASWLNTAYWPLDHLFHSADYENIAIQNEEIQQWKEGTINNEKA